MTAAGGDMDVLRKAFRRIGLRLELAKGGAAFVSDSDGCRYNAFKMPAPEPVPPPTDMRGFLEIRYFEHYSFPNNYRVVDNAFFGMSREEAELRLAVEGE